MDATTKKLLQKLQELQLTRFRVDRQIEAISTALRMAGVRPDVRHDVNEAQYASRKPFARTTLTDACEQILKDYKGQWLTKSQVEYLVARGGYRFSTNNSKNSVDVTLRRLAEEGKCQAERIRGSRGNKYCWHPETEETE